MLAVLAPLLSLLGVEAATVTDRLKRQAIIWGMIGVFGLVFAAFILVAINNALTLSFGPVVAPLIIAVVAAVIAVIVFLVAHLQDTIAARQAAEKKRSAEVTALVTTALITAVPLIFKSPLFKQIGLPAGAALVSALMLRKNGGDGHHK